VVDEQLAAEYRSQEYAPARKLRVSALKRRLTFFEGFPEGNPDTP